MKLDQFIPLLKMLGMSDVDIQELKKGTADELAKVEKEKQEYQNAFKTLTQRYIKLENWAKEKGFVPEI